MVVGRQDLPDEGARITPAAALALTVSSAALPPALNLPMAPSALPTSVLKLLNAALAALMPESSSEVMMGIWIAIRA